MNSKLKKFKINLDYYKSLSPCKPELKEFLTAGGENFSGNILDFIDMPSLHWAYKKNIIFNPRQKILSQIFIRAFQIKCAEAIERDVHLDNLYKKAKFSPLVFKEIDFSELLDADTQKIILVELLTNGVPSSYIHNS